MPHLKFYAEERERHKDLGYPNGRCTPEEAELGIKRLTRHYKVGCLVGVRWTSGNRYSRAGYGGFRSAITLNTGNLNWLLVAHEFGHILATARRESGKVDFKRAHGSVLERYIGRICRYIVKTGWTQGALAHGLALKSERQEARQLMAACPPPIEARIAHREEQVKRLERKVKALTTRLRKARRSLGALQRSARKERPCSP